MGNGGCRVAQVLSTQVARKPSGRARPTRLIAEWCVPDAPYVG